MDLARIARKITYEKHNSYGPFIADSFCLTFDCRRIITTIVMKSSAYLMTGSISLFSHAIESVINLMGAVMALGMLIIPPALDSGPRSAPDKIA